MAVGAERREQDARGRASAVRRALPRLWAATATPGGFRVLALVALGGLWAIVPSGAAVRLTASGLGCPDWPLCNGRIIPAAAGHAWIEYSNRILSGLVMAVSVFAWLSARRLPGRPAGLRRWSGAIALATAGQVPLGAVTVHFDLHPLLVASHFLLSMVALGCGTVLALRAHDHARGVVRGWNRRQGPLAVVAGAALGTVLVTGVLVTAAGPHSGDADVIRRFGRLDHAAYVHVRAVIALVIVALALVAWLWRERVGDLGTRRLGLVFLPLLGAQIGLGEYQWHHQLPSGVVAAHVSVAGLCWAVGLALAWRVLRPVRRAPEPAAARPPVTAPEPVHR
jgi:cytochrome c oxidase assembly protein subunit 15